MNNITTQPDDVPISVYEEAPPTEHPSWQITDSDDTFPLVDQIAWCLRKGAEHERLVDENTDFAQRERKRVLAPVQEQLDDIDAWLADAVAGDKRRVDWFKDRLERWAIADRMTHLDKPNQVKLPSGTVGTTVRQQQITVIDAEEFSNWLIYHYNLAIPAGLPFMSWLPKIDMMALRKDENFVIHDRGETEENDDQYIVIHKETGEQIPGLGVSPLTVTAKVSWK